MSDPLTERVDRARHALGLTRSDDVSSVRGEHIVTPSWHVFRVDFGQGRTKTDLETVAFCLIANIASIKDHLKKWCESNGRSFSGDVLIDKNRDVAIVHDLWNVDKHAVLNRPPRSGYLPALTDLRQALQMGTGNAPSSSVSISFDMETGKPVYRTSEGGKAELVVDATVVDEHGTKLGQLQDICSRAIAAWEAEMLALGIVVSSP